ncbi:transcriptional regulator [Alsobacter metallidurans]|uniref:Transcriptional regulator n=1 Tax=Alsobacter metallidurans TaxID=340221 RepID=A0A917MHS6_9HYPH|nr:Crp/Fnr family transcriptional regulator [Alsobacter metallidurans]GGH18670.1 transcriptional regulator [Alsobacter metallidurans]
MQTLARVPFFKDAGIDFDKFDRRCAWRRYDDDEIVVDFEDASTDVYFILSGDVRILIRTQSGKEIILAEMKGGQFFGELAAIDDVRRSANVTALTRAEMCIMPASVFKEIVFASPVVGDRLLRLLTARIRELNARITEHSVFDLKHRLYAELIRMSAPRAGGGGERVVSPPPFHHVLAARIGCRREQVTRELSALSGQGVIAKTRGALVIRQPKVLEDRITEALQSDH